MVSAQYIWIDSLCILQDLKKDWEIEAGRMASVYSGSYINIVAAGAECGSKGLLLKPSGYTGGALINSSSPNTPSYAIVAKGVYLHIVIRTPLSSRAWAFEERLLPTRTIYFGSADLFWGCRVSSACESFPGEIPENILVNGRCIFDKRTPLFKSWS